MSAPLDIEMVGEVAIVTLPGRVDAADAQEIEQRFDGLLQEGSRRLVADLGGTEYISSAGLRVFLAVAKFLGHNNGRVVLCGLTPFVADVFEMAGFSALFTIVATRDEAVAALA